MGVRKTVDSVRPKNTGDIKIRAGSETTLNQEPYLGEFLTDDRISLDNSDAERNIRTFCVGKHNVNSTKQDPRRSRGLILTRILTGISY